MKPFYFEKSLGIDIREDSVALCLVGKKIRGTEVIASTFFECDSLGPDAPAEISDEFTQQVGRFLKEIAGTPEQIIASLPRRYISVKTFSLPAPDLQSVDAMIEFELGRHFSAPEGELLTTYRVEEYGSHLYRIIAAGINNGPFQYYWDLLEKSGISPTQVDVSTFSNLNLIRKAGTTSHGNIAILDLGRNSVEFSIMNQGIVDLSRTVSIADPGYQEAFDRHDMGREDLKPHAVRMAKFLTEALQSTLYSCNFIPSDEGIDQIHLIGGGIFSEAIAFQLEEETGTTTRTVEPPESIRKTLPMEFEPATMNTALSLALRGVTQCHYQLSLLPADKIPVRRRSSLRTTVALAFITVLLGAGFLISKVSYNKMTLDSLNTQLKEVKLQVGSLEKVDREFEKMSAFATKLNDIDRNYPLKMQVLKELSRILPKDTYVTRFSIKKNTIEIQGFSKSASRLIETIENSKLFSNAAFKGSVVNKKDGEKFTIKSDIRFEEEEPA